MMIIWPVAPPVKFVMAVVPPVRNLMPPDTDGVALFARVAGVLLGMPPRSII
jgi:hypothetical protein